MLAGICVELDFTELDKKLEANCLQNGMDHSEYVYIINHKIMNEIDEVGSVLMHCIQDDCFTYVFDIGSRDHTKIPEVVKELNERVSVIFSKYGVT